MKTTILNSVRLFFLAAFTCAIFFVTVDRSFADTVHDESTADGDLSGDNLNPTMLEFMVGENTIIGSTVSGIPDYFTVTVPDDFAIESIVVDEMVNQETGSSFFAFSNEATIESDVNSFQGAMLINTNEHIGVDILDVMSNGTVYTPAFNAPLDSGQYTFWYQETIGDTNYQFTFNLASTSAVPEPGSFAVLAGLGIVGMIRRRK